jgi:hypothetical protein
VVDPDVRGRDDPERRERTEVLLRHGLAGKEPDDLVPRPRAATREDARSLPFEDGARDLEREGHVTEHDAHDRPLPGKRMEARMLPSRALATRSWSHVERATRIRARQHDGIGGNEEEA